MVNWDSLMCVQGTFNSLSHCYSFAVCYPTNSYKLKKKKQLEFWNKLYMFFMNIELILYRISVKIIVFYLFLYSFIHLSNHYNRYCSVHKIYWQHVLASLLWNLFYALDILLRIRDKMMEIYFLALTELIFWSEGKNYTCIKSINSFYAFFKLPPYNIQKLNIILYLDLHDNFLHYRKQSVCVLSHVWLFATPRTVAYQASLSMGFSWREYWSGLPFLSPGRESNEKIWRAIKIYKMSFFSKNHNLFGNIGVSISNNTRKVYLSHTVRTTVR